MLVQGFSVKTMTSLREYLNQKIPEHPYPLEQLTDTYIKELQELTAICPRDKIDKYTTMSEKWAFTQGYEFCRKEMLRLLRGETR